MVTEIPRVKAETKTHVTWDGVCNGCGHTTPANNLADLKVAVKGTSFGPVLSSAIVSMWEKNMTLEGIMEVLKDMYKVDTCRTSVNQCLQAVGNNLVETHEEMIESVKTAQYLHMDETPYPIAEKCGGKRGQIWTLIGISAKPGQDIILIYATMSRSKEALKAIDPPLWIAITCDGYAVYNMFKILQRCWIHILLVAKNLAREHGEETKEFVTMYENLLDIYDNAKTNRRKSYDV